MINTKLTLNDLYDNEVHDAILYSTHNNGIPPAIMIYDNKLYKSLAHQVNGRHVYSRQLVSLAVKE